MDQHGISDSNDEVDISELLNRLESADGMAKGSRWRGEARSLSPLLPLKSSKPRSFLHLLCRCVTCFRCCIQVQCSCIHYLMYFYPNM
ncbi:hypothetical protein AX14_001197 [Amanita brunnescens Koide BX004]|nr:hypothetical protein AX14_001197 [Amanita brunnescens Koide BX004]